MGWGGQSLSLSSAPSFHPAKEISWQPAFRKVAMWNTVMSLKGLNGFHKSLHTTANGSLPPYPMTALHFAPPSAIVYWEYRDCGCCHTGLLWAAPLSQGAFLGLRHGPSTANEYLHFLPLCHPGQSRCGEKRTASEGVLLFIYGSVTLLKS